ncbi:MAG: glycosyltransferase family 4 protein [Pyrinomonadaceae bacterium]
MTGTNRDRLRIVFAGLSWPPETFIQLLIKGLLEAGAEITVACEQKPEPKWFSHSQFQWLYAPTWRGSLVARFLETVRMRLKSPARGSVDISLFKTHARQIKNWRERIPMWHQLLPFAGLRWDVIYFPWNSAAISYLPLFELGPPVVVSCRGTQVSIAPLNPERSDLMDALQKTFQKAAAVHCVTEAILSDATKYGLDPHKARVIRPAVDPKFFWARENGLARGDTFNITTTGALIWRKGYEYALQSIRNLLDQGIRVDFNILGDGPERSRVLYTIRDLNLQDVVHLHGPKGPEEVRELLQRSDVFLLSSLSEGISNAILEAMACAVPVVTTDCGGMREAVTDGVEGFVVPTRNAAAITEALITLSNDPELRKRMGKAGRRRIEESFSLSQQIDQFLSLCKQTAQASQQ